MIKFSIILFAVVMPHLGSNTEKTSNEMSLIAAQNIIKGLNNEPMVYELWIVL